MLTMVMVSEAGRLDGRRYDARSGCASAALPSKATMPALFNAKTPGDISYAPCRQLVKRAGPGGAGPMLNPFQPGAIGRYTDWFARALAAYQGPKPRGVYHDSFEYQANWSQALPREFERRRGYKLEDHWAALFGNQAGDEAARVKSDYHAKRLSDLMVEEFIAGLAFGHGSRAFHPHQAHGSPGIC
jgi:hypothetical protein